VNELVKKNPRITYEEIEEETEIHAPTIHDILHNHLQIRKICCRWVPHFLTEEQKAARVDFCQYMLDRYQNGESNTIRNLLTGDETWIYCYDEPLKKQQDMQWVEKGGPRPTKIAKQRSVGKVMVAAFFTQEGLVDLIRLQKGQTVTAAWYTENCLGLVLDKLSYARERGYGIRK